MDPVTGSVVASIGSSLLGGLFGGGGKTKSEWVTPKYGDIRRKAEAAGFNPLTALSMNAGGVGTTSVAPTFGQRLANGVADAFSAYSEGKTLQTELDQRERELRLKEKAAEALSQQSRYTSGLVAKQSLDVASTKASDEQDNNMPAGSAKGAKSLPTGATIDENATGMVIGGKNFPASQAFSDGEEASRRFGDSELISTAYGAMVLGADFQKARRMSKAEKDLDARIRKANHEYLEPMRAFGGDERYDMWRAQHNPQYQPEHWR